MTQEKELVRRVKSGDPRAFEDLVTQFEKKIYAMGLRFTGNPQDALDICQEVFLRVYRFIGNFGEESRLSTWIYRIAANVCKDTVAKRSRSREVSLEIEDEDGAFEADIADTRYSPEQSLMGRELQQALMEGITRLPDKYREIIILRDINGLTYDEISRSLDLEPGTVKSRIARARERLRVFLAQSGNISPAVQSNTVKGGDANERL